MLDRARAFLKEKRGGVAVPFALSVIPITVMTIGAVDFQRASMVKSGLQDALDAATLTVGKSTLTDPTAIQTLGATALAANLRAYPDTTLTSSSFQLVDKKIVAAAQVHVTPLVADVFGGDLTVNVDSEVVRAVNKLEIALVLDNTGSMAGTKLTLLKEAAGNFVDTLSAAAAQATEADAVKIGLVPFSMTVNVGTSYQSETWMDQTGASPINNQIFEAQANRFTLFQQLGVTWGGCVEARQAPYDIQDTAPDTATPATLFTPYFAPDEPGSSTSSTTWNSQTWYNSYLADGTTSSTWSVRQGYLAKYNNPTWVHTGASPVGYQYGPNAGCQLEPLVRLSTNWTSLKTAITNMTAIGDTNVPFGLVWGWHLLSPNAPFQDGVAYGTPRTKKVVVLMTDGQNANADTNNSDDSIYSGVGYIWQNRLGITSGTAAQRRTAMDNRLAALCTNMKAQNIVIYTVRVEVNDTAYQVLQNCASTTNKFYDVSTATELDAVFSAIAGDIQNLRISH